jgi:ABC-2 type transport system ATP-binding protein
VAEYLKFAARIKGVARRSVRSRMDYVTDACGLSEVRGRLIGHISKGYRQRVGLAQALVHDPPILILDEPTVGLDPTQIREIRTLMADLAAPREGSERRTIILSTHILNEVEAICQRVILINRGRVALDQPIEELTSGGQSLEDVFARVTARDSEGAGEAA